MTLIELFKNKISGLLGNNKYNQAFYRFIGGYTNAYSDTLETLLYKGYKENPIVNAAINQMASKSTIVPLLVKQIEDEKYVKKLKDIYKVTGNNPSFSQKLLIKQLEKKAYSQEDVEFPLERPNPNQTWSDIIFLYKVFLKVTGNCYLYIVTPEGKYNTGAPLQLYVLPSNWVQIVLKNNADLLGYENPIDYYVLQQADQFIRFEVENVIHIKRANPFYSQDGQQLYGHSELMAGLRNIQSSNAGMVNNVKTMSNSGVYGFVHAGDGQTPLTPEQGQSLKDRLVEMDNSTSRLSNIAGASAKIGFTRISLTTDELKPFEYLTYDQKIICNLLNWPDELMNSDTGGGLNSQKEIQARKRAITDNIKPDLDLLADSLNVYFIKKFKGYENTEIVFDITGLPEMQTDMGDMVEWMNKAPLTMNERREAINYHEIEGDGMDDVWIPTSLININDVNLSEMNANFVTDGQS
jgi:HK97 family phage portal protein